MQHACNVFLTYQQQNPFLKLRILERRNNEEFFFYYDGYFGYKETYQRGKDRLKVVQQGLENGK